MKLDRLKFLEPVNLDVLKAHISSTTLKKQPNYPNNTELLAPHHPATLKGLIKNKGSSKDLLFSRDGRRMNLHWNPAP